MKFSTRLPTKRGSKQLNRLQLLNQLLRSKLWKKVSPNMTKSFKSCADNILAWEKQIIELWEDIQKARIVRTRSISSIAHSLITKSRQASNISKRPNN
ncbi:unnamed protein product [Vicia faba]|uniref:Uncharacterized protein n=1 Tax=Vicia faba TaxID=3906 RepID=A0AAV0ZB83_VICFA|nr:unnamed protein product [Vicia faba]